MAKSIAIVEDDPDQRGNYVDAITKKGYDVVAYSSRQEALAGFDRELPDLAILDIILGDEVDAGFEICRDLLVRSPSMPVIFLTERITEIDKISGLRLGAWDYLPKPISLTYLAERISSLLRINTARVESNGNANTAKLVGDMSIDQEALLVSWKGQPINSIRHRVSDACETRTRTRSRRFLRHPDERHHAIVSHQQHHQHSHEKHP